MTIKQQKAFARWHWRERIGFALIQIGASILVAPDKRIQNRIVLEKQAQLKPYRGKP